MDKGDLGMFDIHTKELKEELGISKNKPVGDMLGEEVTAYKTAAQLLSRRNIIKEDARGLEETSNIIYDTNRVIRDLVIEKTGETPEALITCEDAKEVEKKYNKETAKLLKKMSKTDF